MPTKWHVSRPNLVSLQPASNSPRSVSAHCRRPELRSYQRRSKPRSTLRYGEHSSFATAMQTLSPVTVSRIGEAQMSSGCVVVQPFCSQNCSTLCVAHVGAPSAASIVHVGDG